MEKKLNMALFSEKLLQKKWEQSENRDKLWRMDNDFRKEKKIEKNVDEVNILSLVGNISRKEREVTIKIIDFIL